MSHITEYEIEDIGIDHPQYFTGRSTMPESKWSEVYVGSGYDPVDAFDNAIENMAHNDWDVDPIVCDERALYHYATKLDGKYTERTQTFYFASHFDTRDLHSEECPAKDDDTATCDGCELMYYIAIYVR